MKNIFNKIYLTWRKGRGTRRLIVGEISIRNNVIDGFRYCENGEFDKARREGFVGYPGLTIQPKMEYDDVLKMFSSRLINIDRNDSKEFLDFWEIAQEYKSDQLYLLAMSQGLSGTDSFEFQAEFDIDNEQPFLRFITDIAGLQFHCKHDIFDRIKVGDKLDFTFEKDNDQDKFAVQVLFDNQVIGYIKRGHNKVFHGSRSKEIQLEVKKKINTNDYKQLFVKVSL